MFVLYIIYVLYIYRERERERGRHPHKIHPHFREVFRKVTRSLQSNRPIVFNKPSIRKCKETGKAAPGHSHEFAIRIEQRNVKDTAQEAPEQCEGNCPGGVWVIFQPFLIRV